MSLFHNKYFYFNKKERKGILALIVLLIVAFSFNLIIPCLFNDVNYDKESFAQILQSLDSLKTSDIKKQISYFTFNPNTIDSAGWLKLGLSSGQIKVISKYRKSGGRFYKADDLKKIYVIDDKFYNDVKSYIKIPKPIQVPAKQGINNHNHEKIQINTASESDLDKLKGIGPVFAKRILSYRDLLGGFVMNTQLLEVYGIDSTRFLGFENDLLPPDTTSILKINIREVSYQGLIKHPYISAQLTNYIMKIREREDLNIMESIRLQNFMNDTIYQKLLPYLKY